MMDSSLPSIVGLISTDSAMRATTAAKIYRYGRITADRAVHSWWKNEDLSKLLLGRDPVVTVGLAVQPETFFRIREANGEPPLATVPAEQDAQEFELHFPGGVSLDILTTRRIGGPGAIARYLARHGEGIQQVEFRCLDVDRATEILRRNFGIDPVYAATRAGANDTRINFFLLPSTDGNKVLIEIYEIAGESSSTGNGCK